MTSWVLLVLVSVLLGAPGLAFSGLIPEDSDGATAHLCDGEPLFQGLAPQDPRVPGWLPAHPPQSLTFLSSLGSAGGDLQPRGEGLGFICYSCQMIIQKVEDLVGKQPTQDTIAQAASQACQKLKRLLRGLCKKIMKLFLNRISKDIIAGKKPREICVDLKKCKPKAGLI
ncbi:granulysin isoform X1 [Vicugna pacos]|uniref:Granulysin isoform X1 n=1 Tax=Vicugna pacos TaxID=30538 RepID=A0ABM5CGG0_VICPA